MGGDLSRRDELVFSGYSQNKVKYYLVELLLQAETCLSSVELHFSLIDILGI